MKKLLIVVGVAGVGIAAWIYFRKGVARDTPTGNLSKVPDYSWDATAAQKSSLGIPATRPGAA